MSKELSRLEEILASSKARLDSRKFLERAPADVVEREREKERSIEERRRRLMEKRRALEETG